MNYRHCYATVIVTHLITMFIRQEICNFLKFVYDKPKEFTTLALYHFVLFLVVRSNKGYSAVHIHNVVVEQCSDSSYFSLISNSLFLGQVFAIFI